MGAWESQCGKLDQYGMQHTRAFANLCNAGMAPAALRTQVRVLLGRIHGLDVQHTASDVLPAGLPNSCNTLTVL